MKILLLFFALTLSVPVLAQETISCAQAKEYVNKKVWLEGTVISMKYATNEKSMNYLNLNKPYPNQEFTIVISESYRRKEDFDLKFLENKKVKFYGKIVWYENKNGTKILEIFNPEKIEIIE